jgi:hypothetical protein
MTRCPIYDSTNACSTHSDCLFLRNGGCAILLGAEIADENSKMIKQLQTQISDLTDLVNDIAARLA